MSVVKGRRHPPKSPFLSAAAELKDYSLNKIKNPKLFPKSSRWIYAERIGNLACDIVEDVKRANTIHVDPAYGDPTELLRRRLASQNKALEDCEALIEAIEGAYVNLPLPGETVDYWVGLIIDFKKTIDRWIKSDINRYSSYVDW